MYKFSFLSIVLILSTSAFAQVDIDLIINQQYLNYKNKVDCNSDEIDNLSERICSNIKFQKSDSLMNVAFNKLLSGIESDSVYNSIKISQDTWVKYRSEHCLIIYKNYSDCGGCNKQAIEFLNCLTTLTDERLEIINQLSIQLYEY